MRILMVLLLTVFLAGCNETVSKNNHAAELESVAACFRHATTIMQNEPETIESVPQFMWQAREKSDASETDAPDANFDALHWSTDGTSLVTSAGDTILCRVVSRQHDNYGSSGTSFLTIYEFYIPETGESVETTIELSIPN